LCPANAAFAIPENFKNIINFTIKFLYGSDFVQSQESIDDNIAHAVAQQEHPSIGQIESVLNEELQIVVILLHHI
jgi:hypothetical protein